MAVTWYYTREGKEAGPVTAPELRELAKTGQLTPTDLVWKEGMPEWVEASRITNLFDASLLAYSPPAAAPAPSPAQTAQAPVVSPRTESPGAGAAARRALQQGAAAARQQFGPAVGEALGEAVASLQQLFSKPLRYAFITVLFYVAVFISAFFLITIVLIPVFTMGYIMAMKQISEGEKVSLTGFIDFMRHGWNSLWHMLMMLASYIVTLAAMIAPAVLVLLALYFTLGSVGAVVSQIRQFSSSAPSPENNFGFGAQSGGAESGGAVGWLAESAAKAGRTAGFIVGYLVFCLTFILLTAPGVAVAILNAFLALDVAGSQADSTRPFELVLDSFGRLLAVARTRWKQLLITSLLVPSLWIAGFTLIVCFSELFIYMKLRALGSWVATIVGILYSFNFLVYASIFITRTCISFHKQQPQGA